MTILLTVTNDLTYDQRMQRICTSLAAHGHTVRLVGRQLPGSVPLIIQPFGQKRLRCRFHQGFAFYVEYNLRLLGYLLTARYDVVCSIDLDTLAAGCLATLLRRKQRVFDAHEYFTEVPEVIHRPFVRAFWGWVARLCLPFYRFAYTVGPGLAEVLGKKYGVEFLVVRNTPVVSPRVEEASTRPAVTEAPPYSPVRAGSSTHCAEKRSWPLRRLEKESGDTEADNTEVGGEDVMGGSPPLRGGGGRVYATGDQTRAILFYQGALNAGRGLEAAIAAMQLIDNVQLWLVGEGDLSVDLRQLAVQLDVQDKVHFLGFVQPKDLKVLTAQAWVGLNLLENLGLSYYYSLANKFFDYVQAEVPVVTMNFPEYRALNAQHEVAVLLDELSPITIAAAIRRLREEAGLYARLQGGCAQARWVWTWEVDEQVLLGVWDRVALER